MLPCIVTSKTAGPTRQSSANPIVKLWASYWAHASTHAHPCVEKDGGWWHPNARGKSRTANVHLLRPLVEEVGSTGGDTVGPGRTVLHGFEIFDFCLVEILLLIIWFFSFSLQFLLL